GDAVQVPGAHPRRPAADLGELEPARAVEPLHVRRRRADLEEVDDLLPEHLQVLVAGRAVDAVRGDELRRDPARAHGLEGVGVVVARELVRHAAADGQRVVEALVTLDELLYGDARAAVDARGADGRLELVRAADLDRPRGAGGVARLEDEREADL